MNVVTRNEDFELEKYSFSIHRVLVPDNNVIGKRLLKVEYRFIDGTTMIYVIY